MLSYDFMRRALVVGVMLAIIIPMIGLVMINRKTSMIGDALSHSSLAGIAMGLIFSINPIFLLKYIENVKKIIFFSMCKIASIVVYYVSTRKPLFLYHNMPRGLCAQPHRMVSPLAPFFSLVKKDNQA